MHPTVAYVAAGESSDNGGVTNKYDSNLARWNEQVASRLPEFQRGHRDTRFSYELIVGKVVGELRGAHSDATKHDLKILATVAALDYEMKTLLLRLLEASADRAVWQKYLALIMWQVLEELPKVLGTNLQSEGKAFKAAVKEVRKDQEFMNELGQIRNSVAAHLGLVADVPGLIEWSADSIVSELNDDPAVQTKLAIYAIAVSESVHRIGSSILQKHPVLFPDAKA